MLILQQVLLDFGILFCDADENALKSAWPTIREKPKELLGVCIDQKDDYHKLEDLHYVLTFLKAFLTHRTKFENAVNSMIIFSTVSFFII